MISSIEKLVAAANAITPLGIAALALMALLPSLFMLLIVIFKLALI